MKRSAPASSSNGPARGGLRQRRTAWNNENLCQNHKSATWMLLLEMVAWGEISAQLAQEVAAAAYADALEMQEGSSTLQDLYNLSSIGSFGRYANKCYSEMMKRLPTQIKLPEVFEEFIPFKKPLNKLHQAFLLPHELFAAIWQFYQATWHKFVAPSADRMRDFWNAQAEHPAMGGHPIQERADRFSRAVPISIHGDDVPITGVGKAWAALMTTFSWTSMLSTGETRDCQYYIYGCFERLRHSDPDQGKDTLGCFFKILVWSLHWLYKGVWPDVNWRGKKHLGSTRCPFFVKNKEMKTHHMFIMIQLVTFKGFQLHKLNCFHCSLL